MNKPQRIDYQIDSYQLNEASETPRLLLTRAPQDIAKLQSELKLYSRPAKTMARSAANSTASNVTL